MKIVEKLLKLLKSKKALCLFLGLKKNESRKLIRKSVIQISLLDLLSKLSSRFSNHNNLFQFDLLLFEYLYCSSDLKTFANLTEGQNNFRTKYHFSIFQVCTEFCSTSYCNQYLRNTWISPKNHPCSSPKNKSHHLTLVTTVAMIFGLSIRNI